MTNKPEINKDQPGLIEATLLSVQKNYLVSLNGNPIVPNTSPLAGREQWPSSERVASSSLPLSKSIPPNKLTCQLSPNSAMLRNYSFLKVGLLKGQLVV